MRIVSWNIRAGGGRRAEGDLEGEMHGKNGGNETRRCARTGRRNQALCRYWALGREWHEFEAPATRVVLMLLAQS